MLACDRAGVFAILFPPYLLELRSDRYSNAFAKRLRVD
jgi:hypothetical protein